MPMASTRERANDRDRPVVPTETRRSMAQELPAPDDDGEAPGNECLVDHCLLDDVVVQQLIGGHSAGNIDDPRTEFIRQLGELARQYNNVRVAHVFFEDYSHGALIRIGDDLTWADAPAHWGSYRL